MVKEANMRNDMLKSTIKKLNYDLQQAKKDCENAMHEKEVSCSQVFIPVNSFYSNQF